MKLWPILASLFGPGVAQAMLSRRRTAIAFAAVFALAIFALGFTIWGLAVAAVIWVMSIIDTIVYVARTPAAPQDRTMEAAIVWVALVVVAGLTRLFVAEAFKFPSSSMLPTLAVNDHVFVSKLGGIERGDVIVFVQPCAQRAYGKRVIAVANDTVEIRCHVLYLNGVAVPSTRLAESATYQDFDEMDQRWFTRNASHYMETIDKRSFEIFHEAERRDGEPDNKDFPRETVPSCANQHDMMSEQPVSTTQLPGKIVDSKPEGAPCEPHRHYVVPEGHVFVLGDNRGNSNDSRYWGSVPVANIKGRALGIWRPLSRFGPL